MDATYLYHDSYAGWQPAKLIRTAKGRYVWSCQADSFCGFARAGFLTAEAAVKAASQAKTFKLN